MSAVFECMGAYFFEPTIGDDCDDGENNDDEVSWVRCLSAWEHANSQSVRHQSCRPRGGSMH